MDLDVSSNTDRFIDILHETPSDGLTAQPIQCGSSDLVLEKFQTSFASPPTQTLTNSDYVTNSYLMELEHRLNVFIIGATTTIGSRLLEQPPASPINSTRPRTAFNRAQLRRPEATSLNLYHLTSTFWYNVS